MKKFLMVSLVLAASATAFAGQRVNVPVLIQSLGGGAVLASGSLATSRNNNDASLIGCETFVDAINTSTAFCVATAPDGNTHAACFTSDPARIELARSLNGDSRLEFSANANADCMLISVNNSSVFAPKAP
jgi:hypothetical protein